MAAPSVLFESDLKSLPFLHRGKVREIYAVGDDKLLVVQTDRLSAFDVILDDPIPAKGQVHTALSLFWFGKLAHAIPNHLTGIDPATVVTDSREREQIAGRAMVPDFSSGIGYMLTDGTQKLEVQSNNHFVFYPNYTAAALGTVPEEQAQVTIDSFLKKYGFNFEYRVESAHGLSAQQYAITPLTPDGVEIRTDYLMPINYQVTIDGTGQINAFSGFLLDYEILDTSPIITAEEAFQEAIADRKQMDRMESMGGKGGGGGGGPGFSILNLRGTPMPFPSPTAQPVLNSGTGEYTVRENDTLNSIASNFGVTVEELMKANNLDDWGMIYIDQKLTIPGAQLPAAPIGRKLEGQSGLVTFTIYIQPDGSQRFEYGFITSTNANISWNNYLLEGTDLQSLQKYHNRLITLW